MSESEEEKKKKAMEDLENLSKYPTSVFKKSDFEKMLGDDANEKSDDLIARIFSEIKKKFKKDE